MNQTSSEPAGTKDRILDAAEQLFSENGFDATSLRMITAAAQVNLAAVNYHFRSKEALIQAVFFRRLEPINQKRIELLDDLERCAGRGPLPIEDVLRAFFSPALRLSRELPDRGVHFVRLMGRMYAEPGDRVRSILMGQFGDLAVRFVAALKRALPGLPEVDLFWRLHFTIGAMAHTMAGSHYLPIYSGGKCDTSDVDGTIDRLVAFLAAGFRAAVKPHYAAEQSNGHTARAAVRSRR